MRLFYHKDDKEVTTWFLQERDVAISMTSFFDQVPSQQAIQALEDTTVAYFTYDELQNLYKQFPELNLVGRSLTEQYYKIWNEQFHATKMQTAVERYQWFLNHRADLLLRVPAKYIASYLGITEVTFSKIRSRK